MSRVRLSVLDSLKEQVDQGSVTDGSSIANLDVTQEFARSDHEGLRVVERSPVVESQVDMLWLHCDVGVMLRHLLGTYSIACDSQLGPDYLVKRWVL